MDKVFDDCGDSVELDKLVYNTVRGTVVRLQKDEEELLEIDVNLGEDASAWDASAFTVAEFKTDCRAKQYKDISNEVLTNPDEIIGDVVYASIDQKSDSLAGYSPLEVQIAWDLCETTKYEFDNEFSLPNNAQS